MANPIVLEASNAQVASYLGQLAARLADTTPLMAGIAQELATQVELRFLDEGPDWPQLKPSTVEQRGSAHPILQGITRAMARSFLPDSGKDFAQIGSNDPKVRWHFYGTDPYIIKPKNKKALKFGGRYAKKVNHPGLPARPMLPVEPSGELIPSAAESLLDILANYVLE